MLNEAEKAQQLREITGKIIKVQIMGSIGPILVGLALYAIFAAKGDAFHPLLNDMDIVHGMLLVGGAIMIWEFITYISLIRKRAELNRIGE